jgi:hypothetical protein
MSRAGSRARVSVESRPGASPVAGLILALSFAVLGLVPVRPFRELAFLMSVGSCSTPSSCERCWCRR